MFKVTFINVFPGSIKFEYQDMNRTQAANTLPALVDDYLPGQVKSMVNSWDKRNFPAIYVVQFKNEDGTPRLNTFSKADSQKFSAAVGSVLHRFDPAGQATLRALQKHNPNGTRMSSISGLGEVIDVENDPEMFEAFFENHPYRAEVLKAVSH